MECCKLHVQLQLRNKWWLFFYLNWKTFHKAHIWVHTILLLASKTEKCVVFSFWPIQVKDDQNSMKLCVPLRKSHKTSILAASLGPKSQVRFKVARKSQSIEEELMEKKAYYSSSRKKYFFLERNVVVYAQITVIGSSFFKEEPTWRDNW